MPLAVEDEVSTCKLRIVVTSLLDNVCVLANGLNLNVSVRVELSAIEISELISFVLCYSTLDLIVEGDSGNCGTFLLAVDSESELGEVSCLSAKPFYASGDVECLYFLTILAVCKNVYGSTTLCEVILGRIRAGVGLVTLLDLGSYDSLESLRLNVCCVESSVVEGNVSLVKAGESVTEVEVLKFNALARTLGVSVDVCGVDLICPDNHTRLDGLEILTVYIVINGNGVVSIELNLDNNVKPATPTVLSVNCYGTNCVSVIAVESYPAVSYGSKVDKTYGGFRPTVVGGATPIAGTTVSIDLELSTSSVCVLHIDSEGHESGSCVSVGEACKLSGLSLTGNPDFVLNVCTVVSEFESTVFISLGVVCILNNAEVVSVVHTTVKYVVVSTGRTCVSNLVAVNSNYKVVVSSSLSVYCATVKAVRDTCCLAEVVLACTADPAARTGDVLRAVLGSVKHVKLTVESVVIGVTEGNVIKCEAGVSNVSPTVDVEASYVKVLTGRRNYVLSLGCGSLKLAVDVVTDSDLTVVGKGDMKLYGEPLGPAVTCSRDGSESSVAVETSSKGNTVCRVCADVKHVVVK